MLISTQKVEDVCSFQLSFQFHSDYQPAFTRIPNWAEHPSTGVSEEYMLAVEIQDAACMEDQALAFPRLQAHSLFRVVSILPSYQSSIFFCFGHGCQRKTVVFCVDVLLSVKISICCSCIPRHPSKLKLLDQLP